MDETYILQPTTFNLSMTRPGTEEHLTANAYTVKGVTDAQGNLRPLSIGQLVMAICLQRASQLEVGYEDPETGEHVDGIIDVMDGIELTSAQLEALTAIESAIIDEFQDNTAPHAKSLNDITISLAQTPVELLRSLGVLDGFQTCVRNDSVEDSTAIKYDDFITKIESKMDEKNSFSQKTMIELQSLTNKRDQCYDMVSNILKSLNTVLVGTANTTINADKNRLKIKNDGGRYAFTSFFLFCFQFYFLIASPIT